jgi:serine/threonine-protein kinase RsbW
MVATSQRFTKLDDMIDELHSLFDQWSSDGIFSPDLEAHAVGLLRLSVHEWVANLIQHADFQGQDPEVILEVVPNGKTVKCVIKDNSAGFDAAKHLRLRMENLERLPERGMGLLMLNAATEYFEYSRSTTGLHRLEFSVSADVDPWLNIPF